MPEKVCHNRQNGCALKSHNSVVDGANNFILHSSPFMPCFLILSSANMSSNRELLLR